MKSKTSFFNRKLMVKYTKLYWPVWGVYLAIMLLAGPINLWLSLAREIRLNNRLTDYDVLDDISMYMSTDLLVFLTMFMAIATAMSLFSYLYNTRSANMMHAFPVTRLELFGTSLLTGLGFIIVPMILNFLLNVFVCLGFGVVTVEYFGIWLLVGIATASIMYGMAVFCAMLTGQLFTLPIFYFVMHLFYFGVRTLVQYSVGYLGFGIGEYGLFRFSEAKLNFLAPVYRLCVDIVFRRHMTFDTSMDAYICDDLTFYGGWTAFAYGIAGIVFMVLAYVIYRKRNVEQAGDLMTVSFVKPIFRWGIGLCGGIAGAFLIGSLIAIVSDDNSPLAFVLSLLIGGLAFFSFAEMMLRKNFRVWNKRLIREAMGFLCFGLIFFFGVQSVANRESHMIPSKDSLKSAVFYYSYQIDTEQSMDAVDDILVAHKAIIDYLDTHDKKTDVEDSVSISFVYKTKDGGYIRRNYTIPLREDSVELLTTLSEIENTPDYFIAYNFNPLEEELERFNSGSLETYDENYDNYVGYTLDEKSAPIIAAAIIKDIEAGNIQKYNNIDPENGYRYVEGRYAACINLYGYRYDEINRDDYYEDDSYVFARPRYETEYVTESAALYLNFGQDSVNLVQALIETGVIESEEDLHILDPDYYNY